LGINLWHFGLAHLLVYGFLRFGLLTIAAQDFEQKQIPDEGIA